MSSAQAGQCPVLAIEQDILTAENIASLRLSNYSRSNGTVVNISCYTSSYQLQGNSWVTCMNGSWVPETPVCVIKPRLTTTTPAYNNTKPTSADPYVGPYDTIVIITSCMLAIIIIFLLVLLVYKFYTSRTRSNSKTYELPSASTNSTLPLYTTRTGSHVIQSSFPGSQRSWTYLSVDRLIRDIETSRKENPRHSWRDFATISSYSTKRL